MTVKYFFNKIKDVKPADYFSIIKMTTALALLPFYRKKISKSWICCETAEEARDNGYCFFKYVRENNPDRKCYYAINKNSVDYEKVRCLGNTIEYGSIRHWMYYFTAEYNISSQKGGKPNTAVCALIELSNLFDSKFVFLQHGIIINKVKWAFADRTRLKYFICSTKPEYNYILQYFGYKKNQVVLTGLPRFDNLHNFTVKKNRILIMPTWRSRYILKSERNKGDNDFLHSNYYTKWKEFLNHNKLGELIDKYNLEIIFYPHRNMQKFIGEFSKLENKVLIASWQKYDIQDLLRTSSLMITDYSSVFFDMVYMKKPVIFYQFDAAEFKEKDYQEGYFDYSENSFGQAYSEAEGVLEKLEQYITHNYSVSEEYLSAHRECFTFYDADNSARIYRLLDEGVLPGR